LHSNRSLRQKEAEGWRPAFNRPTGFAEQEVSDYLQKEKLTPAYAAA